MVESERDFQFPFQVGDKSTTTLQFFFPLVSFLFFQLLLPRAVGGAAVGEVGVGVRVGLGTRDLAAWLWWRMAGADGAGLGDGSRNADRRQEQRCTTGRVWFGGREA